MRQWKVVAAADPEQMEVEVKCYQKKVCQIDFRLQNLVYATPPQPITLSAMASPPIATTVLCGFIDARAAAPAASEDEKVVAPSKLFAPPPLEENW